MAHPKTKLKVKQKNTAGSAAMKTAVPRAVKNTPPKTPEPHVSADQRLNVAELDALIGQSEQVESSARQFMEPQSATPKKKRGRPSNAEKAERQSSEESRPSQPLPESDPRFDCKPACRLIFGVTSAWIVRYTEEPKMALYDQEIAALGDAWGAVAERYLPAFLNQYGEIVGALAVTGTVGIRLYHVSSQLVEEKQRRRREENERIRGEQRSAVEPKQTSMSQ